MRFVSSSSLTSMISSAVILLAAASELERVAGLDRHDQAVDRRDDEVLADLERVLRGQLVGPPDGHHRDAEAARDAGERVAVLDLVVPEHPGRASGSWCRPRPACRACRRRRSAASTARRRRQYPRRRTRRGPSTPPPTASRDARRVRRRRPSAAPTGAAAGARLTPAAIDDDQGDGDRQGPVGGQAEDEVAPVEPAADGRARSGLAVARAPAHPRRATAAGARAGVAVRASAQDIGQRRWHAGARVARSLVWAGPVAGRSGRLERMLRDAAHDAAHGVQQYVLLAGRSVRADARGLLGSGPSAGRDLELGFSASRPSPLLRGLRRCTDLTTRLRQALQTAILPTFGKRSYRCMRGQQQASRAARSRRREPAAPARSRGALGVEATWSGRRGTGRWCRSWRGG